MKDLKEILHIPSHTWFAQNDINAMYYKESKQILKEIKKAKKILINCHAGADADSVGSASSLAYILKKLGYEVVIGAPEKVSQSYNFLLNGREIETVSFNSETLKNFDLLIIADSEHWGRIFLDSRPQKIKVINIDHHIHNNIDGDLNLKDKDASSTCEMLYLLFSDWKIKFDKELSSTLLAGIFSDTGFFQYASTTSRSCRVAGELIEKGADFNNIVLNLKRKRSLNLIKMWGYIASNVNIDETHKFAWSAMPNNEYIKLKVDGISPTSEATDYFLRVIEGMNFAIGMVEKEPKKLHLSLRARVTGFDVSQIAKELNGGGHKDASGAAVFGLEFNEAVEKVLQVARKYALKA